MAKIIGWKPIPTLLKIISILSTIWFLMAVLGIRMISENGFPLLGMLVFGIPAIVIVLLLYLVAPATFLYALLNRKNWTARFALSWIGFFLLNSAVAMISNPGHFGSSAMYVIDLIANSIFFIVFYRTKSYFA